MVVITPSLSSSHSPSSPLVTVTKLVPSITALTPRMSKSFLTSGDFSSAVARVGKFIAPRGSREVSSTYFRVLGLGVHSSWMFTDISRLLVGIAVSTRVTKIKPTTRRSPAHAPRQLPHP